MDINTRRFTVVTSLMLMAFVAMLTIPLWTHADSRTEAVLPQMGQMRSGQNVTVVNLTPVDIGYVSNRTGENVKLTLSYGDTCYMFKGALFVAIGLDGQRVLVRSRVPGTHHLIDDEDPVCSGDVLFWIGYQQYLLSAQVYREAERERLAKEDTQARDRRIIRELLDSHVTKQ